MGEYLFDCKRGFTVRVVSSSTVGGDDGKRLKAPYRLLTPRERFWKNPNHEGRGTKRRRIKMTQTPTVSVTAVIPAFNEEKTIAEVVEGARKHVTEVLVIDDGSVDRTVDFAMKAGARVISIPRNTGKGHALSIGLTTAA